MYRIAPVVNICYFTCQVFTSTPAAFYTLRWPLAEPFHHIFLHFTPRQTRFLTYMLKYPSSTFACCPQELHCIPALFKRYILQMYWPWLHGFCSWGNIIDLRFTGVFPDVVAVRVSGGCTNGNCGVLADNASFVRQPRQMSIDAFTFHNKHFWWKREHLAYIAKNAFKHVFWVSYCRMNDFFFSKPHRWCRGQFLTNYQRNQGAVSDSSFSDLPVHSEYFSLQYLWVGSWWGITTSFPHPFITGSFFGLRCLHAKG